MKVEANSVEDYLNNVVAERKEPLRKLVSIIKKSLPKGFREELNYGMIGFVVPHSIYPNGYHCDTSLPLPFIAVASQKQFIALYHMGVYADPKLLKWFVESYNHLNIGKLDMGKSCIRFKKIDNIPYDLVAELCKKMTPTDWIKHYEKSFLKKK